MLYILCVEVAREFRTKSRSCAFRALSVCQGFAWAVSVPVEQEKRIDQIEMASAIPFLIPGKCTRVTVKLCSAAVKNRWQKRFMILGCLEDWPCHARTMDMLSQ